MSVSFEDGNCQVVGGIIFAPSAVLSMLPWFYLLLTVPQRRGISYLERCYSYATASRTGLVIEIISAILSVASCALYIAGTYMMDNSPWWFQPAEVSMSTFFFSYWIMHFILNPDKISYATSLHSFVDILTVMPVMITTAGGFCEVQFGIIAAARVLKFFRVLRLLRVLRSFDVLADSAEDAIRRQTMRLISIVVVILVVTTGFVQYLCNDLEQDWEGVTQVCDFERLHICQNVCPGSCESKLQDYDGNPQTVFQCRFHGRYNGPDVIQCKNEMMFHDSLYYTIVTFSTVGYGDVVPITWASRVAMVFLISITVWAVPHQLNKLQALKELQTEYDGVFRSTPGRPHVILSCNASVDVRPFIAEFFHEDHTVKALVQPQLVLLIDCLPSNELRHTLLKYAVKQRLFFVRGDATSAMDLGRARVDDATSVFLLADRTVQDQDEQDQMTVLRALTARRTNPNVAIYAQMMQPENENLIINAGVPRQNVMCMNQMRLGLLGTSVACPGLPTMLLNLIQSISWRQSISVADWHEEYSEGMTMEIYSFKLKTEMCGMRFGELAIQLKKKANSCVFAIAHDHEIQTKVAVKSPVTKAKSFRRAQSQKSKDKPQAPNPGRRPSIQNENGFSVSRLTFNPGSEYKVVASDIIFAFADEAKRLEDFERYDDIPKPSAPLVQMGPMGNIKLNNGDDRGQNRTRQMSTDESVASEESEEPGMEGKKSDIDAGEGDEDESGNDVDIMARNESQRFPSELPGTMEVANGVGRIGRRFSLSETIARMPSNAGINTCLDSLLSSIVDTYGDSSRGVCDHLKAYIKDQVSGLISLEEQEPAPLALQDYLILKAPLQMRNHIIVVAATMDDMQYLIRPIRCSLRKSVPVVFVTCKFPSPREWLEASQYGDVWVMQLKEDENGTINSAALRDVLEKAGIQRARACLVCADLKKMAQSLSAADSSVMQAVLIAHELTKDRNDMILISELTQGGFSRKLALALAASEEQAKEDGIGSEHEKFTQFALEGKDGMEMQMEAFNLMQGFQHLESAYVAGSTIITSLLDLLVCQQYFNPYVMSIIYQIVLGQSRIGNESESDEAKKNSVVVFKQVPKHYVKKTFMELFEYMVKEEGTLVMGLYRRVGEKNKAQHFVLTNPKPTTILRGTDCMYIIRDAEHRNETGFTIPYSASRPTSGMAIPEHDEIPNGAFRTASARTIPVTSQPGHHSPLPMIPVTSQPGHHSPLPMAGGRSGTSGLSGKGGVDCDEERQEEELTPVELIPGTVPSPEVPAEASVTINPEA